jgi:hypothetical protein
MWPTRSLFAGCGQSIDYSRLALWRILEAVHAQYRPRELETWVDDLHHLEIGHMEQVIERITTISVGLAQGLREHGFKLSEKSALVTSPPRIAQRISAALREHDIHVLTPGAAKDLGVATHGVRRTTKVIKGRMKKAARRALAIRKLIRVEPKARALVNTGYRPQAIWGHEGQGLAPSTLRLLRSQIAGMTGCMRPGGCATTCIRLTFGAEADPRLYGRLQLFEAWFYILDDLGPDDRELQLAWSKTVKTLEATKRPWQRVKGTMAAVIASLLDLQWTPRRADEWLDSDGEEFALRSCDRARLLETR